jgi:hypothetical protein
LAANSEFNVDDMTADEILEDIQSHLVPEALMIPAAVGELVFLQDKGYRLVVNH